jgi:1,2-diacylglycerol 3-beta-galactosyltransferase
VTRRILILMSDTGGGHRSAAQALADAFAREYSSQYEVILADVIARAALFPFNHMAEWYLPFTTYAEFVWGLAYHATDNRVGTQLLVWLIRVLIGRRVRQLLREYSADLVVSVHPVLNKVPCRAQRAIRSTTPFAVVVTDLFTAHGLWFNPDADLTIVATAGAQTLAEQWGMSSDKLCTVGLPVSLKFVGDGTSQAERRRALGLDPEKTTALLVGGAEGMGRLLDIVRSIDRARLPLQLVVIAGRNRRLFDELHSTTWHIPVVVQRFVTNMPDWMRASDVIITKAGPGTISEALACGLPIVLSGFLPGQEEGNVTFVEQSGVGVLLEDPDVLAHTLGVWLAPGNDTLRRIAGKTQQFARPRAALEIARLLDDLLTARGLSV